MIPAEFDDFIQDHVRQCLALLNTKSNDYASDTDKLFNFKKAAEIEGNSPLVALRGMDLKHRVSIAQGIDEFTWSGKLRPFEWWAEKFHDHINYSFLALAIIKEHHDSMKIVEDLINPKPKDPAKNCHNCGHKYWILQCKDCRLFDKWEDKPDA